MNKFFLLNKVIFLLLISNTYAQENNLDLIDKSVERFCRCSNNAKTKADLDNCGDILKSIERLSLLKDSLYLLAAIKNTCGEKVDQLSSGKFKSRKVNKCHFLQQSDLALYNLIRGKQTTNSTEWESDGSANAKIVGLRDSRDKYEDESKARLIQKKQKAEITRSFSKIELRNNQQEGVEVYFFDTSMGMISYQIFIQEKNLTGHVLMIVKGKDQKVLHELVEKLKFRITNGCDQKSTGK